MAAAAGTAVAGPAVAAVAAAAALVLFAAAPASARGTPPLRDAIRCCTLATTAGRRGRWCAEKKDNAATPVGDAWRRNCADRGMVDAEEVAVSVGVRGA